MTGGARAADEKRRNNAARPRCETAATTEEQEWRAAHACDIATRFGVASVSECAWVGLWVRNS